MQGRQNLCKFTEITGFDVFDRNNQSVGTIHDLAFDPENGQIRYALVKAGAVLGIGGKTLAVPFRSMDIRGNRIHLSRTKDELMSAPWYEPERALTREYERTAYTYWGEPYYGEDIRH